MTITEIKNSTAPVLKPSDIAEVLGCRPYYINVECRQHPERVKFPFMWSGTHLHIPRVGFINWYEGRGEQE